MWIKIDDKIINVDNVGGVTHLLTQTETTTLYFTGGGTIVFTDDAAKVAWEYFSTQLVTLEL